MMLKNLLILVAVLMSALFAGGEAIAEPKNEAKNRTVLVSCRFEGGDGAVPTVWLAGSSEGAPTVQQGTGTNCAQTISDLLSAGLTIKDIQGSQGGGFITYTFIGK